MSTPNIVWTETALVQPSQRQLTMNPPEDEIAYVVDAGGPFVVVVYSDGSDIVCPRYADLPILAIND